MDTERWQTIERLFFEATELEATERDRFLVHACVDDKDLLIELRSMLDATGEDPRLKIEARLHLAQAAESEAEGGTDAPLQSTIDRYELKDLIGRGGMGEVYRAARSDGEFHQEVALKLVSGAVPGPSVIRRFKAERQILARLDHPNIARLVDGGTTEDGRPYLVMQLIDGVPITEYCDREELGIRDRLALFRTVCEAVQYAHQNLVIHRDLKPSNILVTADGEARLLDFGIAKLLEPDEDLTFAQTGTDSVLMTPESAAPEQIAGEAVTTATDVYGLGVLLYRLLTGHHPFGETKPTVPELRTWILEGRRIRPSAVALDANARRAMRGEIDNIVLKTLRKDPLRRYGSAGELGDDISRYLNHEPVRAAPDSAAYRVKKFVRRHPVGVTTAATIAGLIIGFALVTADQSRQIEGERDRAEQMVQLLVNLFETSDPTFDANQDTMRVSAFIESSRQQVVDDLGDQPDLQVRMKHVLGQVYAARSQYPEARELFQNALDQHQTLVQRPDSLGAAIASDLGRIKSRLEGAGAVPFLRESVATHEAVHGPRHPLYAYALASLAETIEDRTEGRALLTRAVEIQRESLDGPSVEFANSLNALGVFAYLEGDFQAAADRWTESTAVLGVLRPPDSPDMMTLRNNTAQAYLQLGEIGLALEMNQDLLERRRRVFGDSSLQVAATLNGIGTNYAFLHDYPSAEASFREAVAVFTAALDGGPLAGAGNEEQVAAAVRNVGVAIQFQGRPSDALDWLDRAIARQSGFGGEEGEPAVRMRVQRANVLNDLNEPGAALDSLLLLAKLATAAAPDGGSPILAETQTWLGRAHWMLGAAQPAEAAFRSALEFRERVMGPESGVAAESRAGLGLALVLRGDEVEGGSLLNDAIEGYRSYGLLVPAFLAEIEAGLTTLDEEAR